MIANHIARRVGPLVQQRIDHLGIGQKMQDLPEELWHKSFRFYVKEDPSREGGPNLRLLRLHPERPAPTVTGYIFNKFVHPFENRFITVREAARLQGFPDTFKFQGTLTSTQLQVGNAVPVQLSQAIFEAVLRSAAQSGYNKAGLQGLSLFSGAGGMDIGAAQASHGNFHIETQIAIDNWLDACKTLESYYYEKAKVVHQDLSCIHDPLQFWQETSSIQTLPDLIYGGPPCQSFSQAGKQRGFQDDRGQLVLEFLRFVDMLKPSYFVIENVANLKGVDGGRLYHHILDKIVGLGYHVTTGMLVAADFGTPQLRKRLIFVGSKQGLEPVKLPEPLYYKHTTLFAQPYLNVSQAFANLPPAEYSKNRNHSGVVIPNVGFATQGVPGGSSNPVFQ